MTRAPTTSPAQGYRPWQHQDASDEAFDRARTRVGLLLVEYTSLANVFACFEDLMAANPLGAAPPDQPLFAPRLVAHDSGPHRSLTGATVAPHRGLDPDVGYDAIIVPAVYDGNGYLSSLESGPLLSSDERAWLRDQHRGGATITTMCSGSFLLAEAGLLEGRECSIVPLFADSFRARFPGVQAVTNRSLVVSGDHRELVTGGASVYSADVSLFTVARFAGVELAVLLADIYGKAWETPLDGAAEPGHRDGGPALQDALVRLARRFVAEHLEIPGVIGAAAELAHVSERTLRRRFVGALGMTPREYVRLKRMERACDLLARSRVPIDEVAARVGYGDRSAFARAFRKVEGLGPADYRRRFHRPARLRA